MKKAIITAIALIIKGMIFYCLIVFGISLYDTSKAFYLQNPLVWITLFLPMFMGYEALVNTIFSISKKQKPPCSE